jgi:hypothetical protein
MISELDLPALGIAVLYLGLGIALAALLKRLQVGDSAALIGLLILPLVTYGVASGKITELAAGGVSAKFAQVAAATVKPAPLGADAEALANIVAGAEDLAIFEKAGLSQIQDYIATLTPGKPIAISLRLGRAGYYAPDVIIQYIQAFLTFDPDLTIIFVDHGTGRFAASANANSVLAALTLGRDGSPFNSDFLRALESGDLTWLGRLVALTTNAVTAETTNADALRMMVDDGVDSIVKVDEALQAKGIVRRDAIISGLMLGLADG